MESLIIENCEKNNINDYDNLDKIKTLIISNSKITSFPENKLINLEHLWIMDCNDLTSIPNYFPKLIELNCFGLNKNTNKI